jgi:mono/diheme cytochrome c family protein
MMNCMSCHGPDGRGMALARAAMPPLPDFSAQAWQAERSNPQLKISILDGKGTFMPSWRGKLSPEIAQSLVSYVRSFGPASTAGAEAPPSEFEQSFESLQKQWDALEARMRLLSRH